MYNVSLEDIDDAFEVGGLSLHRKEEVIFADNLCNSRWEAERRPWEYDLFSEVDMLSMAEFYGDYLRLGGHGHIFCAEAQLPWLRNPLKICTKKGSKKEEERWEKNGREAIFDLENNDLRKVWRKEIFIGNLFPQSLCHISMVGLAVHFWSAILIHVEPLAFLNYHASPPPFAEFAVSAKVVNGTLKVLLRETVFKEEYAITGSRRCSTLRHNQKPIDIMR